MVELNEEYDLIIRLKDKLKEAGFNASNSTLVSVSADYSSIVWQILRHQLSHEGEFCDGFTVDVPYPDQEWTQDDSNKILSECSWVEFKKNLILIEAGVIRGSNYRILSKLLSLHYPEQKVVTVALFENERSAFKSDYVAEYYDNTVSDLTFWWEVYNKHWK
jgi:hypothetical protein